MILHTYPDSNAKPQSTNNMIWALLVSTLVHATMLFSPSQYESKTVSNKPIEVEILRPQLARIAPASQAPEAEPSEALAILKSEKNQRALEPQIRRGQVPLGKEALVVKPKAPQAKIVEKAQAESSSIAKLKLDPDDLRKFSEPRDNKSLSARNQKQIEPTKILSDYKPFLKNSFSARFGSPDLLPNVRDGEITLLNTKADIYAVFVRRVALKVFSELRHSSWSQLSFMMARSTRSFVTVRATMSKSGKLLGVELLESSGNDAFDSLLNLAAKNGTWDQNPPDGAQAGDGKIHFIFKAKTWAQRYGDRSVERRWLLLATGLE